MMRCMVLFLGEEPHCSDIREFERGVVFASGFWLACGNLANLWRVCACVCLCVFVRVDGCEYSHL